MSVIAYGRHTLYVRDAVCVEIIRQFLSHKTVQVNLKCSISETVYEILVRNVRIQTMFLLPFIRDAVTVSICRHSVVGRVLDKSFTVVFRINDTLVCTNGGTAILCCASTCLIYNSLLDGITVYCSGIVEYRLIGIVCTLDVVDHIHLRVVSTYIASNRIFIVVVYRHDALVYANLRERVFLCRHSFPVVLALGIVALHDITVYIPLRRTP